VNPVSYPPARASFVEDYADAARRFARATAETDLRLAVSSCPGWTAYDVVVHLGNVHAWAATIVETGRRAHELDDRPRSSRPRAVAEWYAAKAEDLLLVLRHTVPDRPCWSFVRDAGQALFWQRRQLHETLVHLLDLDGAAGRPSEITPAVAANGVGEVVDVMLPRMHARGRRARLQRPLGLVATDTDDSWLLTPTEGPPAVTHERHADVRHGPDRVEATAAGLYRLLWQRGTVADVDARVLGDVERVTALLRSPLVP
jgi:uncharacterized protein (TIGR03083 family)